MALARAQYSVSDQNDPIMQGTAPACPVVDMLWLNTSVTPHDLRRWTGSEWASVGKPTVIDIPQAIPAGASVVNTRTSITDTGFRVVNSDTGEVIGGLYAINGQVFLGASALVDPRVVSDFAARIATKDVADSSIDQFGLSLWKGAVPCGYLMTAFNATTGSPQEVRLSGNGLPIRIFPQDDFVGEGCSIHLNGNVLEMLASKTTGDVLTGVTIDPNIGDTVARGVVWTRGHLWPVMTNAYNLGHGGNTEQAAVRYRRLYCTMSVDVSSDARQKDAVGDVPEDFVLRLRPRLYRRKDDPDRRLRMGLYAQEVKEALDGCGLGDADLYGGENPDSLSLRYEELIAPLIATVQSQQRQIEALAKRLSALEGVPESEAAPGE